MLPNRSSGRKRWNLHDGPQGSLRRLRNQLAEDGCAESQVVLAKQLLDEKCELEADKVSNFKQALEWLICATEQGHPEARRLLRRCVRSGVVDEHSATIVRAKSCLKASRQETVARKAARDLFASLSNGEQYITTAQLERRIRQICSVTLKREAAEDSDAVDDDSPGDQPRAQLEEQDSAHALQPSQLPAGDHVQGNGTANVHSPDFPDRCAPNEEIRNLTVDNLVSAAVDYCQGELPLVTYDLTLTDPGLKALDHIPLLHQAFLHPIVFLQVLYLKLLYYFGTFSFRLSNFELSFVLVTYLSVSADNLSHFVPLVLYYASFIAMVICTFKMLHAKRQFVDFRKWSGLFLRYSDGNLLPDESENLFVRNNLGPFLQFFLALFVNLFIYPFIATQWVPFSEFCVLSFVLMFLTIFSFGTNGSPYPDLLALVSFALNVLAKYPYEKDTVVHRGWRFLDLYIHNYPSYILGNSIEFCLNARVFFSLLIPVVLFFMTRRSNWRGFMRYTLPHCVTLSWLQMFIMCSHGCTTYGLIRGTLGLVCSFLFVPLIGVVTLTLPIFAFLQCITLSRIFYTASVVIGIGVSLAVTCALAKIESTKKYVTPFQLSMGLLMVIYFGNQIVVNIQDDGLPSGLIELVGEDKASIKNLLKNEFVSDYDENTYHISWDDYYAQCSTPSWTETNSASTQIKCAVLEGTNVNWEGYIKDVKVKSVKNRWSTFASWLPGLLREYFKCYYGEEYSSLCGSGEGVMSPNECEFVSGVARQSGKSCHLDYLNEYTYEVKLIMEAGGAILKRHAEIKVTFDHYFTNFTRLLRTDDKVRFKGVLLDTDQEYNIGSKETYVNGYEINCLECKEARGSIGNKAPSVSKFSNFFKTVANDCVVSTKYILNFLLNPVIVFK